MVKQIDIHSLNPQVATLLKNIQGGEEYIVVQNKRPIAKIVGLTTAEKAELDSMESGEKWTEDDFDIKLSDE
jgi:antitoxin (DNA-binding transcriptional repressor) of toxin-antitoxin stability system